MLVTILLALFAAALSAKGGTPNNVSVQCKDGQYFGAVEVTVTVEKSALSAGKTAGVYYSIDGGADAATFDNTKCVGTGGDAGDETYCDTCPDAVKNVTASAKVLVVVGVQGAEPEFEVKQSTLNIAVTNVNSLSIKKDTNKPGSVKINAPDEDYGNIDSVVIKQSQRFGGTSGYRPDSYCGTYPNKYYPKGDCYKFKALTISDMTFLTGTITSNRKIADVTFTNVVFFAPTKMTINIYPGVWQGGSMAESPENDGVERLKFENVKLNPGTLDLTIEGNALDVQWNNVTSAAPLNFKTTGRTTENDVHCSVPSGCTEGAYGNMNLHKITNSDLFLGSKFDVAGWVEKIETSKFAFNEAGNTPDFWFIRSKKTFGTCSRDYNVGQADFFGGGAAGAQATKIDPDIHFSICKANFKNVIMSNNVQSESDAVTVEDSIFNGYIRHVVGYSLAIANAAYNKDTYYDHYTDAKYNYPTVTLNTLTLADIDFVLSVDNGTMDETLTMQTVTCAHKEKRGLRWNEPTNTDKVLLVRHMSQKVIMETVTGCNLYFKNTVNNGHTTRQIDLGTPQSFTYDSISATNTDNNYAFFDDAAFHVTTYINIKNNPSVGYIKFNRVNIDSQQPGGQDIHPPEVDPLGRPQYGNSYPVVMEITDNTLIHHLYVTNDDTQGMTDPANNATGMHATGGHGNDTLRDITYSARHAVHQNDDISLKITKNEIQYITLRADSIKADITELLNYGNFIAEMADSSSIRITETRSRDFKLDCSEALEATIRHTVFDGITSVVSGKSSLLDFRTVAFNNLDHTLSTYTTPYPVHIITESGYINFDHVKIEYGDLDIQNRRGDIKFVQSLSVVTPTKVTVSSHFGKITVTRPTEFTRDMNGVYDYENTSGNRYGFEYAQSDSFFFEPAPSMRVSAAIVNNLEPVITTSNVVVASQYGNVTWEYAKNLEISKPKTITVPSITFKNFDNVIAMSSIAAASHEVFYGFDIENLDLTKTYLITVLDTCGNSEDILDNHRVTKLAEASGSGEYTCTRTATVDKDPFNACHGFLILPTVDLTVKPDLVNNVKSLNIDSTNVFFKDCASTVVNSLKVTGAGSVYVNNLIAYTIDVTLAYNRHSFRNWWRDTTYVGLFGITATTLKVTGVAGVYTEAGIAINSNEFFDMIASTVDIKSLTESDIQYTVRNIYPNGGVSTLSCESGAVATPYSTCAGNTTATSLTITIPGVTPPAAPLNPSVSVSLGTGAVYKTSLYISHAVSHSLNKLLNLDTLTIGANENIIIDNHRFATNFASSFNGAYQNFGVPNPTTNNVYIIPVKAGGKFGAIINDDRNVDGMLYTTNSIDAKGSSKTHKFNLMEQSSIYFYIPMADGISITTAGDNINLFLGDIGTYGRIYTTSYLVANVLKARVAETVAAAVYSLQGSGSFTTNYGYVGINADKASAKVLIETDENDRSDLSTSVPFVVLEKATMADIGIYARKYKTITTCPTNIKYGMPSVDCYQEVVPCREAMCDIVNYIWEPTYKMFWVGKDFDKSTKDGSSMFVRFNTSLKALEDACPRDGRNYGTIRCPNTPAYSEDISNLSSISIRGSPKITSTFEPNANKNNRSVNPVLLGEVQVESQGMPGWAIGLIVISCIIAAIVLIMFILRLLGKESLGDFGSTTVGALGPTN